jgi:hypothetical protein
MLRIFIFQVLFSAEQKDLLTTKLKEGNILERRNNTLKQEQ